MKVLINTCYGGFSFSEEFEAHIKTKYPNKYDENGWYFIDRSDPVIVDEALSFGLDKASGMCARITAVEIPDGVKYSIDEYDGSENIGETWVNVTLEELKSGLSQEKLDLIQQVSCIRLT